MQEPSQTPPVSAIWTPLKRTDLEIILARHDYTTMHLVLLSWLIWLSLLTAEELLRLLSREEEDQRRVETKADLSKHLATMRKRGIIDVVTLREPFLGRYQLYYATDMGLYLYLSTVHPSPPLTIARLARSYPVERDDLLGRLARPQMHRTLMTLATRLIEEGTSHGYHLISYQEPWNHLFPHTHTRFSSDAALLLQHITGSTYAFLIHSDTGPHHKAEKDTEKFLHTLLDLRQKSRLSRQSWPGLLIISTRDRLPIWAHMLGESSFKQMTKPLAGGLTTLEFMSTGIYAPIWWDLMTVAMTDNPEQLDRLPLTHLFQEPASTELVEQFSQQQHLYRLRLKDAASPPPRTKHILTRYVGHSLQDEAMHLTKTHVEDLFATKRRSSSSTEGGGLLTLRLTATQKEILTASARHPLLDVLTLQAILRPEADAWAIKPLQQQITHLFQQGLIETRIWPAGKTPFEQQRYLLTPVALKFMAIRQNEPLSYYFVLPKYHKGDDEQLDRQWGTRGLAGQMGHTNGLYTFMRQILKGTNERGEVLSDWKSAHEAARWYKDSVTQLSENARPDAEFLFAVSFDAQTTVMLLEYDRATTGEYQYTRKFKAYLDYQQATGRALPLIVVVTPSQKAAQRMQHVLGELQGSLPLVILLERDLRAQGLSLALHHVP